MATSTMRLRQINAGIMVVVALLLLSVQVQASSELVVGSTDPVILSTTVDTPVNSTDVAEPLVNVQAEETGFGNSTDSISTVDASDDGNASLLAQQAQEDLEFDAFAAQYAGDSGELPAAEATYPGGAVDAAEIFDAQSSTGAPPGFEVVEDDPADSSTHTSDVSG